MYTIDKQALKWNVPKVITIMFGVKNIYINHFLKQLSLFFISINL